MSDFASRLAEARRNLPLRRVIEQAGKAPANGNWKSFPECPFCHEKGKAGVFVPKSGGGSDEMLKCFNAACAAHTAVDEIGFIALDRSLSREEAWPIYFKEAGVWREDRLAPSVMPGKAARRPQPLAVEEEDEKLVAECVAVICEEQKASVSLLQRRLQLGYTLAARIMDVLERRGVVGPARGAEPREVLNLPSLPSAEPVAAQAAAGPDASLGESDDAAGAAAVHERLNELADSEAAFNGSDTDSSAASVPVAPAISEPKKTLVEFGLGEDNAESSPAGPHVAADTGAPSPDSPMPPVAALRWFYERLQLVAADRELLWRKRGLTEETVTALGFRSNLKSNRDVLLAMPAEFPLTVLYDSGLWLPPAKAGEQPKPNAQYCGMAVREKRDDKGKKVRDRDGEPVVECVFDDPGPILIPYFDAAGLLVHLRPHKGMMKGRTPRFYCVRPAAEFLAAHPEYKFPSVGVAALPGITMAKPLFGDVDEWLEGMRAHYAVITEGEFKAAALWQTLNGPGGTTEPPPVRSVVVGYDNEDKSNPQLPGYQEDKWKRFDAQIWALYLARQVAKEGYDGKVVYLPDEWRDAKGKADWDGRLAARLQELQVTDSAGLARVRAKLRGEFEGVIKHAFAVHELWQAQMFDSEEARIIKNGLERISYERALPIGGEPETVVARRLQRLGPRLRRSEAIPLPAVGFLSFLAKSYLKLDGRYYNLKKLTEKMEAKWQMYLEKASASSDTDLKRACEIALKGIPEPISDFYMEAQHLLVKVSGDRVRLVVLRNVHGVVSKVVRLPAEAFASPTKFREWLLNNISGATWRAGERELQALQMDIAHDLAFKEIEEVAVRGYHAESRCWFFGDVAYLPNGQRVFADRNGIIWVRAEGELTRAFKLAEQDHEGQDFCQKTPKMHPNVPVTKEELQTLFNDTSLAFYETIGDHSGFLCLGAMLACGAGPEIYEAFTCVPALWVHGETRQGKSTVVRMLMRVLGFMLDNGMPLADSTKVGLSIALQQYGELTVWLEEFQPGAPQWMIEKIKNVHNRESGIKKTFDEGRRKIVSSAIVTGIATCRDAQVKSRFIHAQVSAKNRKGNHLPWFNQNSPRFYQLFRQIMENRAAFAARTLAIMRSWMTEDMPGVDERARTVYGAAYAAFVAFNELLGNVHGEQLLADFKRATIQHAASSVAEVTEQVNVNQFWRLLLDAFRSDAFGETPAERRRVFKWVPKPADKSPLTEYQLRVGAEHTRYAWESGRLYFKPGAVLDMLRKHLRQRGQDLPLEQNDLKLQMQTREYFVMPTGKQHLQVFVEGSRTQEYCWCINPDFHELGLRRMEDAEWEQSLHPEPTPVCPDTSDIWLAEDKWVDPRRGDLFMLIQSLKSQRDGEDD